VFYNGPDAIQDHTASNYIHSEPSVCIYFHYWRNYADDCFIKVSICQVSAVEYLGPLIKLGRHVVYKPLILLKNVLDELGVVIGNQLRLVCTSVEVLNLMPDLVNTKEAHELHI